MYKIEYSQALFWVYLNGVCVKGFDNQQLAIQYVLEKG